MMKWIKQLDEVLRGDATRLSRLENGRVDVSLVGMTIVVVLLAAIYGICMGVFAVIRTGASHDGLMQMLAAAVKLPLLFILTILVTFPSLYVFNALVGSRLNGASVARLLMAMMGVLLAVLASLGPIAAFFAVSTTSYSFMKLLHVTLASASGFLALAFLLRTLERLVMVQERTSDEVKHDSQEENTTSDEVKPSTLERVSKNPSHKARVVFRIWVVVFALVGVQMSWILRPFIGSPDSPFQWLRARDGNFFVDVAHAISSLFS